MNQPFVTAIPALLLTVALAGPAAASPNVYPSTDAAMHHASMSATRTDRYDYPGSTGHLLQDVQSANSDGASNVNASLIGGTATVTGYTDSTSEAAIVELVRHEPGVDSVVDRIEQIG